MQFYMNLYSKQQVHQPFPDVLDFPRISGEKVEWLERPFEENEFFEVIRDFNGAKFKDKTIWNLVMEKVERKLEKIIFIQGR